jgi:hypothetical protein
MALLRLVATHPAFAGAGFGDGNGHDGAPIAVPTYCANRPGGCRAATTGIPKDTPGNEAATALPCPGDPTTSWTGDLLRNFIDPLPLPAAPANAFRTAFR